MSMSPILLWHLKAVANEQKCVTHSLAVIMPVLPILPTLLYVGDWFGSVTGAVCSLPNTVVHAVILITVSKDQWWQHLELPSGNLEELQGCQGVVSSNSHAGGVDAKFGHLFIFLLACRSTVAAANATVTSDSPCSGTHSGEWSVMCCAVWNILLCFFSPLITLDFGFLLGCEQAVLNSYWRRKFFTCTQCPQWPVIN